MIYCLDCNSDNREGAKFCRSCGAPLHAPDPVPDETPAARAETESPAETIAPLEAVAPPADVAADDVAAPGLTPLAVGARIQERYTILGIKKATAEAILYRVRDEMGCPDPDCLAENPIGETFCQNCGRELGEHPTLHLEERQAASDSDASTPTFVVGDRWYTVQAEDDRAAPARIFPAGVRLRFSAKSDVGLVRGASGERNEDSALAMAFSAWHDSLAEPTAGVFIVADGVGGSDAGEVASQIGARIVAADLLRTVIVPILEGAEIETDAIHLALEDAIHHANDLICQAADARAGDLGTTLTLALIINGLVYIANVGDSRTYWFTAGKLEPITRDHSLVANLVERGMITAEQAYTHPQRNVIIRSLGSKTDMDVDVFPALPLEPGSRLLLCSDGLWEMVRDPEIEDEIWRESEPEKLCANLIARANQAGGDDNITVVVVNVE